MPGRRRSTALQSFSLRRTSDLDIILNDEDEHSFVSSYSSLDKISGQVQIRCGRDTIFHQLEISFEGITETYIERVATTASTSGRTTSRHRFLKLLQPIDPSLLPEGGVAKAGVLYTFPFEFVVPDRLLDHQCTHQVENPQVREAHIRLPPSFGDPMLAGDGQTLQDDMAPEMAKIRYMIRARMTRARATGTISSVETDKAIKVRIVPAIEEDPPLDIDQDNKDFQLRKEKDVKKGLFKGTMGRMVAEAAQPTGFRLPALKSRSTCPISTMATVKLRFEPVDNTVEPPRLGSIVSKLRSQTFFASEPFRTWPSKSSTNSWDTQRGSYVQQVDLSSRCISSVEWEKHDGMKLSAANLPRRQSYFSELSTSSINTIPEPSATYQAGTPFYTARVLVPMSLPRNKSFTPTFHSCSVSRTYILDLRVSYHTPGAIVSTPSLQLKVPIQISAEGNPDLAATISEEEAEILASREVDEELEAGRFSPRSVAPSTQIPEYSERQVSMCSASHGFEGRSGHLQRPPGYSLTARTGSRWEERSATAQQPLSPFGEAARLGNFSLVL